ncbi:KH domain-containing protein [Abeliophyllum distichum]|uniref:KH domain-containing protein n=1 Tax=Abeliophyllum distichum TaxID=126358 RepID=A0ABD1TKX2_9LAMI
MAEELTPSYVAPADDHPKRKLEDLELNDVPEPLAAPDSTANSDPDSVKNATEEEDNGAADESEVKRPRFESNDCDSNKTDDVAPTQNGHQKEELEVEPKEEQAGEPEAVDNNDQSQSGQELAKEATEMISSEQLTSDKNDNTESGSAQEQGQPKGNVQESTVEVLKEDDVPSTELQSGSDTQILSHKMEVPSDKVGVIIGKAGDTIRSLQDNTGAKIQIVRDADADPHSATRPLELIGTLENIKKAEKLIKDVIAEADAGGSPSLVARGFSTVQAAGGGEQLEIQVPIEKVGLIIGKGGETIRNLQTRTGARIQLLQQNPPEGDKSRKRIVRVTGNKKQIETATEMIKEVMNQTIRQSPLSSGYNQQAFHPRGSVASQWGPRASHHEQFTGYDYPQRGPYSSQNSLYPPPAYGQYPPQQAPRSSYGPSWEQRPPATMHGHSPQVNYGQPQGPDYGQSTPYSQIPAQHFGLPGYNEVKYDHNASSQHFGHMGSQPTAYSQGGTHSGYGSHDQYGKPPMYEVQPELHHSQSYGQPRPNQPGEVPYQGPAASAQAYGQTVPPQQPYPYVSTGLVQQSYAPYGSVPPADGYSHPPSATASGSGYPAQGGQPVAGYGQPGGQQTPVYTQAGPTGGYGSYPSTQPGPNEQPAGNNAAYVYQGQTDPAYGSAQGPAAYGAPATGPSGYAQTAPTQPGYNIPQSGGYQ